MHLFTTKPRSPWQIRKTLSFMSSFLTIPCIQSPYILLFFCFQCCAVPTWTFVYVDACIIDFFSISSQCPWPQPPFMFTHWLAPTCGGSVSNGLVLTWCPDRATSPRSVTIAGHTGPCRCIESPFHLPALLRAPWHKLCLFFKPGIWIPYPD